MTVFNVRQDATREHYLQLGAGCDVAVANELVTWRYINGSTNTFVSVPSSARTLFNRAWHHIALILDGQNTRIYIDGVLQSVIVTGSDSGTWALPAPTVARMGARLAGRGLTNFFNGGMDEVTVYHRALTAAEVAEIHADGVAGKCAGGAGGLTCVRGLPPVLHDLNACTIDACDPVLGVTHAPGPSTWPCNDGLACTASDHCDGTGQCIGGGPAAAGTACSDGLSCSENDICNAAGQCSGTPVSDSNVCTIDFCDPVLGAQYLPAPASTTCADSSGCTQNDHCNGSGVCTGTAASVDDGNPCTTDTCTSTSASTFTAVHTARTTLSSCNDGNACNGDDQCLTRTTTQCTAVPSGAVAFWPFDGYWNDVVGGHTAVPELAGCSNCLVFGTQPNPFTGSGQALSFSTTNVFVDLNAHASALNLAGQATIELWLRMNNDTCRTIFQLRQDATHEQTLQIGNGCTGALTDELLTWTYVNGATTSVVGYVTTNRSSVGNWQHVAVTFDGTNTRFYVAGVLVSTTVGQGTNHGDYGNFAAPVLARLGGLLTGDFVTSFNGSMDEVTIYNRALAASEISAINTAGRKCWTPVCVPYTAPPVLEDHNSCTADSCVPATGPMHSPIAQGSECWVGGRCSIGTCGSQAQCGSLATPQYCQTMGDPCTSDEDCGSDGLHGFCITEASSGVAGGVCSLSCIDPLTGDQSCPANSQCMFILLPSDPSGGWQYEYVTMPDGTEQACLPTCTTSADCPRSTDLCDTASHTCRYSCNSSSDCAPGSFCDCEEGLPCSTSSHSSFCVPGATSEVFCADHRDDDADGPVDCDDADCAGSPDCGEICTNNINDDADDAQDCEDSECDQPCEVCTFANYGPQFVPNVDEDGDALADCRDPDCLAMGTLCVEGTLFNCLDGADNDLDGRVDCADPECPAIGVTDCQEHPSDGRCADGLDNDADDLIDCQDPTCALASNCREDSLATCSDGIDNDFDSVTDCADSSCSVVDVCREDVLARCTDGIDNDLDTSIDCADAGCSTFASCREDNSVRCHDDVDNDHDGAFDCLDSDCQSRPNLPSFTCVETGFLHCADGIDNDEDGASDCRDSQCSCFERCNDGRDNNQDGFTDCDDFDYCLTSPVCGEDCLDGVDNNFNGRVDCADPRCDAAEHCEELLCSDALDNELDGRVDCQDTDCQDLPLPDATCNGIDEDCDDTSDEDFASESTSCGTGVCARQGDSVCIAGVVDDGCEAGLPSPELCDGLDNDCDGAVDDDFPRCFGGDLVSCNEGVTHVAHCDDDDACNGIETCAARACLAGTPPVLDDNNDCTVDRCESASGPVHDARPVASACEDGDLCTQSTTCDSAQSCTGGVPVSVDDGDLCTADHCESTIGPIHVSLPTGISCSDDNVCNGDEVCVGPLGSTIHVDPRQGLLTGLSSYELPATAHALVDLGVAPGDRLELRSVGSFVGSGIAFEPDGRSMQAMFTASPVINVLSRIASDAPQYEAPLFTMAEDFAVPTTGVVVTVPAGATHLFVVASDLDYEDNADEDADFGFQYRVVNAAPDGRWFHPVIATNTFLQRLNDFGSSTPTALSLQAMGLASGDTIELSAVGRIESGVAATHTLLGLFSSNATILGTTAPLRVPGAVASDAPPVVTPANVAEDFVIPQSGMLVTVPAGANWLFVGANELETFSWRVGDNADSDGDFGVVVRKHTVPFVGCAAGTDIGVDDGNACTQDSCDALFGAVHSPYSQGAQTCFAAGAECGTLEDGCGATVECGQCAAPAVCGDQTPNRCGPPALPTAPRIHVSRMVNVALHENGAEVIEPMGAPGVARAIDSNELGYYYFGTTRGSKNLTIRLMGDRAQIIDRASLVIGRLVQRVEVWATDIEPFDPANLVRIAEAPRAGASTLAVSFPPTAARFVRVVLLGPASDPWAAALNAVQILTREREGGIVSLHEGGARILGSPIHGKNAIDFQPAISWQATTEYGLQLTMRLSPQSLSVDQLELQSPRYSGAHTFALDLFDASDGSNLEHVFSGNSADTGGVYTYDVTPAVASSARFRPGDAMSVTSLRLYTQQIGGASVPFDDITGLARDEVASWLWSFGDGATSSEQHPLHVYAAPGTYDVSLRIVDVYGRQSTATTTYTVLEAPVPAFEWSPVYLEEGGGDPGEQSSGNDGPFFSLLDRSSAASGHSIVERSWSSVPAASFVTNTTTPNSSLPIRFFDDGEYDVTLRVLDSQLLSASTTHRLEVVNVPPRSDAGIPVAGIWGLPTRVGLEASALDQGAADANNLFCRWDFGDGTTHDIADCRYVTKTVAHTYADAGVYIATLTVFDDDTRTTDSVEVTQNRRFTTLVPQPLVGTAEDGVFVASAQLVDTISDTPLVGFPVRIRLGEQEFVSTTNAEGIASASLRFEQLSFVIAEYAFDGDSRYDDSRNDIEYLVREGDTEPQEAVPPAAGQEANRFIIGFPQNAYNIPARGQANFVGVLMTSRVDTEATVSVPGLGFSETVRVVPGKVTPVALPVGVRMGLAGTASTFNIGDSGLIQNKGVEVVSDQPISVYGLDFMGATTDGFSAIPVDQLGSEYLALAYQNEKRRYYGTTGGTQVGIVATDDDTSITITPTADVTAGPQLPNGARKGEPFTIELDRLQTFQIVARAGVPDVLEDLSGTHISSSKPIAVLGGHVCTTIGGNAACDHLVEQIPPLHAWGTHFITAGLPPRELPGAPGEYIRVLASVDGTEVRVDGELIATLGRGKLVHIPSGFFEVHEIITSAPALVAQYAKAPGYGAGPGGRQDPFMVLVPAVDQFTTRYELAVATPNLLDYIADRYIDEPPPGGVGGELSIVTEDSNYWDDNRLVIIAPVAEVGGIRVDGAPVSDAWVVVGAGDYAVARVRVQVGHHRVTHARPGVRFGLLAYGYQYYDSFAYPGGLDLGRRDCVVTVPRPADGIDNDCDGIRDEEYLNGLDDDGDGLEDEDLLEGPITNSAPTAYPTQWDAFNAGARDSARVVTERFALPAFDTDGDEVSWQLLGASRGQATIAGNVLSLTDDLTRSGVSSASSIELQATDGELTSEIVTLQVSERGDGHRFRQPQTVCETSRPEGVRWTSCNEPPYPFGGSARSTSIIVPLGEIVHYAATVNAHDPDMEVLEYRLTRGPAAMQLDPASGVLTWNISHLDLGAHDVDVLAYDPKGEAVLARRINLNVVSTSTNQLPVIASSPVTSGSPSAPYTYPVIASDPEGTALSYQLLAQPTGMSVSSSGLITWAPTTAQVGTHSAIVRVTDAQGAGQSQSWTIEVSGSPLRIVSAPSLQAAPGVEYHYRPVLIDETGGTGPYAWDLFGELPEGLNILPGNGDLLWTPAEDQQQTYSVYLQVTDTHGHVGRQYFSVEVEAISVAPLVTSAPVTEVVLGGLYLYNVNAADFGYRDVLSYELVVGPPGMMIDPLSGVIQWIPEALASETVTIRVTDTSGLADLQTFVVSVVPDTHAPSVTIAALPVRVAPNQRITLTVTATDDADVASRTLAINGVPFELNSSHQAVFVSDVPGAYLVTASATDPSGNVGTATLSIGVTDAADVTAPVVGITTPSKDADLSYVHDIVGSVSDANLMGYRLDVRRIGSETWRQIGRGYAGSVSGVLGQLDTTMLENGYYELRLTGDDVNARTAQQTIPFRVSGQAKVGVVQLDFVDMVVPMAGIPITIGRHYDSRFKDRGDFGFGWRLSTKEGQVQHNRHPGTDWFVTQTNNSGTFNFPCNVTLEHEQHYTEIRISDREWYLFKPVLQSQGVGAIVSGHCQMNYIYELVDGSSPGAQLFVAGNNVVLTQMQPANVSAPYGVDVLDGLSFEIYNPQNWELELSDGRVFGLNAQRGIVAAEDRHGNSVSFLQNGIAHSDGKNVTFERDPQGRISRIIDPLGRTVSYGYDLNGDLVRTTDALGDETGFSYHADHPHHLDRVTGSDGRAVAALEYDTSGRLSDACDAQGSCSSSAYDTTLRTMTQRDATSRASHYAYDTRGNVTSQTDALGHTVSFEYDADDNLIRAEGPDGSVVTYTYDASHNLLTRVLPHDPSENPADFTYAYTYNARNDRENVTLPGGGVIDFVYDASGNMTRVQDGAGNAIQVRSYNANGTLATRTDRFGTVSYNAYDQTGQPTLITDPFGAAIQLGYDAAGQLTSRTEHGVTTTMRYDALGRPMSTDYGTEASVAYEYRSASDKRWTAITGPTFGRVERTFTASGRVGSWTESNGDESTRLYDPAGRTTEEIDPLGNRTTYQYDVAGRLESITDVALNATTTFERDSAGRVTRTIDAIGNETETNYLVGGRLDSTTNARGFTTSFDRTPTQSSIEDALSRTTVTSLTQYGLPTGTSYPGGASTGSAYLGTTRLDGAQSFPTSFSDEQLRRRDFEYDARSGLTRASDLAGQQWNYQYAPSTGSAIRYDVFSGDVSLGHHDGGASAYAGSGGGTEYRDVSTVGGSDSAVAHHLSRVTSPLGETTQFNRGENGRIERVVYPDAGEKQISYGSAGLPSTVTLPQGTTLTFEHDEALREVSRASSLGESRSFTYGVGDRIETMTDDTGTTTYHYDASGRFSGMTYPHGGSVGYERDTLGRTTSVSLHGTHASFPDSAAHYAYDENGNLEMVTDFYGLVTSYVYDEVDRLHERTLPNGVTTTYGYDARDRITSVVHTNGLGTVLASVLYERSASGEPTKITREDGSYVVITYDAALRVDMETYYDASDTLVDAIDYDYDLDGNRTSKDSLSGGYESYTYTAGFKLSGITSSSGAESYGYDGGGRQVSVMRGGVTRVLEYNSDDKLTRVLDDGLEVASYTYDGAGRRVRSVQGGVERVYFTAPNVGNGYETPQVVTDASGLPIAGYLFAGEHAIAKYTSSGFEYYLQDAMGSVIGMTDANGASTATIKYDSFGEVTSAMGASAGIDPSIGTEFRFHGMQLDAASGLYHVRARAYDTRTGRFASRDPVDGIVSRPEANHPYVFNHSSPHAWRDPSGRFSLSEMSVVSAVQGILTTTALSTFAWALTTATVKAAVAVCTASLAASAALDVSGVEPPDGPCTTGGGKKFMFHYTEAPPENFSPYVRAHTWWTDQGSLLATTAQSLLGLAKPGSSRLPPEHVVIAIKDSNFQRFQDLPTGLPQWFNAVRIPRSRVVIQPLR